MNNLKIKSISLQNIGGIKNLDLQFNENFNLICGTNGIGKTTILESIAHFFSSSPSEVVRKKASTDAGSINMTIFRNDKEEASRSIVKNFSPVDKGEHARRFSNDSSKLLSLKTHRDIKYKSISAITRDPEQDSHKVAEQSRNGIDSNDIKQWFIGRFLWSAHENALVEAQRSNLEKAKLCFSLMDPIVEFNNVQPETHDIMVKVQNDLIYFEYLSSGYKSCLYILLGIIKQIEYRFTNPSIKVEDFSGVILIDEIDIHLHPVWQTKLVNVMKTIFPHTQFITTTHSPHIIQSVSPEEILALEVDQEQNVFEKSLPKLHYGFQGWTIEEILTDVMGLEDTRGPDYKKALSDFEYFLEKENETELKEQFKILDNMLHPQNSLRKILRMQMSLVVDEID